MGLSQATLITDAGPRTDRSQYSPYQHEEYRVIGHHHAQINQTHYIYNGQRRTQENGWSYIYIVFQIPSKFFIISPQKLA
jgi:hypothetical protein